MSGRSRSERVNTAGAAAQRAWLSLAALETARTSDDVDRARHGAQHELETILRVLGFALPELPRGAAGARGRRADKVIVDEELPFDSPGHVAVGSARNEVVDWWNAQLDTRPGARCCGRPDCVTAGGRRFGCTC